MGLRRAGGTGNCSWMNPSTTTRPLWDPLLPAGNPAEDLAETASNAIRLGFENLSALVSKHVLLHQ